MKYPTVNKMIAAIEHRVCIRKLWNCKAGWGMSFVIGIELNEKWEDKVVVYSYFPTLEQCIKMEYRYSRKEGSWPS